MRTIIDIPKDQAVQLDRLGSKRRLSRTELIRRAIAQFLRHEAETEGQSAFGIWRDRKGVADGLAYQEKLRSEWER